MGVKLYCVTNKINGKMYVGITSKTLKQRWATHQCTARREGKIRFHRAILKYGAENFELEDLHSYGTRAEAEVAEIELIAQLESVDKGYNSSLGGDTAPNFGRTLSPEHRAKIAASHMGIGHTDEARAKMSASRLGTKRGPRTDAHRAALSRAHTGQKRAPLSESHRAKLSDARKRYWRNKSLAEEAAA